MDESVDAKRVEIDRVKAAVSDMAKLMRGRFEIDEKKIRAFASEVPARDTARRLQEL